MKWLNVKREAEERREKAVERVAAEQDNELIAVQVGKKSCVTNNLCIEPRTLLNIAASCSSMFLSTLQGNTMWTLASALELRDI